MVTTRSGSTGDVKQPQEVKKQQETHVVTGGGGYVGLNLGKALRDKGHKVILFDIRQPAESLPEGCTFIKGDVREYRDVEKGLTGADCVYHVASYGMSGREQLNKTLIEAVNVQGTNNIIEACCQLGIQRLVYTSTFNVVFGGQVIENGDELLPYLPLDKHPDHYSRTKSMAEMCVLKSDGREVKGGGNLHTCALRLAGVYGPGEQRHLPRIVDYIERGLFKMTYGGKESLVEFLHIDNLVQAHVKAGEALGGHKKCIAAGQAYFISDCKPVNNFEFFRPLVEGLGYKYPSITVPISLIYFMALLTEVIHSIIGRIYNFQPLLTRTEVYKTGVTHYFNNAKAKRELSYEPTIQNDLTEVVNWFKASGHGKPKPSKLKQYILDLTIGLMFAMLIMSFLPLVK